MCDTRTARNYFTKGYSPRNYTSTSQSKPDIRSSRPSASTTRSTKRKLASTKTKCVTDTKTYAPSAKNGEKNHDV